MLVAADSPEALSWGTVATLVLLTTQAVKGRWDLDGWESFLVALICGVLYGPLLYFSLGYGPFPGKLAYAIACGIVTALSTSGAYTGLKHAQEADTARRTDENGVKSPITTNKEGM
jgi:hypothetical protein